MTQPVLKLPPKGVLWPLDGSEGPATDYAKLWGSRGPKLDSFGVLGKNVSRVTPIAGWIGPKPIEILREERDRDVIRKRKAREWVRARERRALRRVAQRFTDSVGVGKCGWCRVPGGKGQAPGSVTLARSLDGGAGWLGVATCGSTWECAECNARIVHRRKDEIQALVDRHRAAGGVAYMLTLTGPHHWGDRLVPVRKKISGTWQYVQMGKGWKLWREKLGIVGTVRVLEVTHGPNGWHPHLHVLVLLDAEKPAALHAEFKRWVYERWAKRFTKPDKETGATFQRPTWEHGITWNPCEKGEAYLTKMGLVHELAGATGKKARRLEEGHRTPWQILQDVRTDNRPVDIAIWKEYAQGMRGARQLTWSRGLRERYRLDPEQPDLELAADRRKLTEYVYTVEPSDWDTLIRRNTRLESALLEAAAVGDVGAVVALMDRARGLPAVPF